MGWGQSGLRPWPLGRLGQRVQSSSGQMHRPGGAAAPGRKVRGGPRGHGGGALPSGWGPWVSPALVREPLTSEPHTHFFLPHRALPVMYAVALDLRIFANNVSLVSVTVLNPNSLYLLLNFMSLLPQVLGGCVGSGHPWCREQQSGAALLAAEGLPASAMKTRPVPPCWTRRSKGPLCCAEAKDWT